MEKDGRRQIPGRGRAAGQTASPTLQMRKQEVPRAEGNCLRSHSEEVSELGPEPRSLGLQSLNSNHSATLPLLQSETHRGQSGAKPESPGSRDTREGRRSALHSLSTSQRPGFLSMSGCWRLRWNITVPPCFTVQAGASQFLPVMAMFAEGIKEAINRYQSN